MKGNFSHSLRAKILLPLAIVMISVSALSSLSFGRRLDGAYFDEFSSKGEALAKSLASSAQDTLLSRDASTIQGFIDEYKGIRGVGYVYVVDGQGKILAHTFTPAFPAEILTIGSASLDPLKVTQSELTWGERHFLDIRAPILAGSLGFAHVGMDLDQAKAAGRAAIESVLLGALFLSLIGLGCIFLILNRSIRRVIRLSSLSRQIAEGNQIGSEQSWNGKLFGSDEIGVLAANFFKMISELKSQRENLESIVGERTNELSVTSQELEIENTARRKMEAALRLESRYLNILQQTAVAANETEVPAEALRSALKIVVESLGYSLGHAISADDSPGPTLRSMGIWHFAEGKELGPFKSASENLEFVAGLGLPGLALSSRDVAFISDVTEDAAYIRRRAAKEVGLKGAVAVPIFMHGQIVAVLEFVSSEAIKLDPALHKVLSNVGMQVGRVFERMQVRGVVESQRAKLVAATKMSSLGEMAGGIAHEINNPLAIIKTLASQVEDLLADDPIEKPQLLARASKLIKATERIATIVQGLRTFSRDGSNDPFCSVSVSPLIEETLSFCRERLQKHGIELTIEPVPTGLTFEGRATQISQVLVNLLHNADDAISRLENKWIRISVCELEGFVEIRVTDSGLGISPEVRQKLFQPFFSTKEIGEGTGLGLSVSLGIMKAHRGECLVDDSCANTCFVLRLPIRQAAPAVA